MLRPLNFTRPYDPLNRPDLYPDAGKFWDAQTINFDVTFLGNSSPGPSIWLPKSYEGWLPGGLEMTASATRTGHGQLADQVATYTLRGSFIPESGFLDGQGRLASSFSNPADFRPVASGDDAAPSRFILIGDYQDWEFISGSTRPGDDGPIVVPPRWRGFSGQWYCIAERSSRYPIFRCSDNFTLGDTSGGQGGHHYVYDFSKVAWGILDTHLGTVLFDTQPLPDGSDGSKVEINGTPVWMP